MNEINALEKLGFSKKEAKVYIELLKMKEATATTISNKTGIDRVLIYQIVSKLILKGFISQIVKNKIKYFHAANPSYLVEILKEKKKTLDDVMPRLKELAKSQESDVKVELFQGKEGLRKILKDILNTEENYSVLGEEGKLQKIIPLDLEIFLSRIIQFKIKEKVLIRKDLKGKIPITKNSECKYIPEKYLSPVTTIIYGNKVASLILNEPFYVSLTTNEDFAKSFNSHFQLLWKIAKK